MFARKLLHFKKKGEKKYTTTLVFALRPPLNLLPSENYCSQSSRGVAPGQLRVPGWLRQSKHVVQTVEAQRQRLGRTRVARSTSAIAEARGRRSMPPALTGESRAVSPETRSPAARDSEGGRVSALSRHHGARQRRDTSSPAVFHELCALRRSADLPTASSLPLRAQQLM